MKYDIKFSCGHEETIELFGNGKERERKIAYYEEYGVCSECYRKHLEDVAKHNADFCNDQGLVITIGSSAQVREAYKIAANFFTEFDRAVKGTKEFASGHPEEAERAQKDIDHGFAVKALATTKTKADFWIDNQYVAGIFKVLSKELKANNGIIPSVPCKPDVITGSWNGRIYGKAGKYRIYIDGKETFITDEQAEECRKYGENR